ncbi:MAG: SURF1 family protein [Spongiibacteraceae bacterium]
MRFEWHLDWRSLLAIVIIVPLLTSLGFWQLDRADEKTQLLASFDARRQLPPQDILVLQEYENYRPAVAVGEFDSERYWLLDNRIYGGKFGYEIVALFTLIDGRTLLVNRGWLAGDSSRQRLPVVDIPAGQVTIHGEFYRSYEKPFSLGELPVSEWPRRVQWLELDKVAPEFDAMIPTTLRLFKDSVAALHIDRMVINVSPAKHRGYAFQWFVMAIAFLAVFMLWNSNIMVLLKRPNVSEKD